MRYNCDHKGTVAVRLSVASKWLDSWNAGCTYSGMSRLSQSTSLLLHIAVVLLLLLWSVHPAVHIDPRPVTSLFDPLPYRAPAGGGGMHEAEPVRKGVRPPSTRRVFTAPLIQHADYHPAVIIDAPPELTVKAGDIGDPNGLGKLSAGMGGPFGIGDGRGSSAGNGEGSHLGEGVDGVYTTGQRGVSAPVAIRTVDPEYSEAARKARLSGSVLVYAEIGPDGHPRNLRVVQSMGLGLDEKALEAVAKWLFRPGMKNGRPVMVRATFEVNFRLL